MNGLLKNVNKNGNLLTNNFVGAKVNGFREIIITNIKHKISNLIIFTNFKNIEYKGDDDL